MWQTPNQRYFCPMNVNRPPNPRYSFFHNPKIWRHPCIRHLRIFGRHIYESCAKLHWLQFKCTRRTCYFKNFVCVNACPPPTGGERSTQKQRKFVSMLCTTKQHVLNIQLTDMWYLDISSLALTYIYLSRTNNNFWHWSTQEELKTSQILWLKF